jgi:hypothetical protein
MFAKKDTGSFQQAITQDGACSGASLWLFDEWNLKGDEICFSGAGTAQLRDFPGAHIDGGPSTWSGAVRSYWAGSEVGGFYGPAQQPGQLFCGVPFGAYQRVNVSENCVTFATQVYLSN